MMNDQERKDVYRRKDLIRCACFLMIFVICFSLVQPVISDKWLLENTMQATTRWYDELKELPEDTVDVFFCGTSHVYASVDPMYMYENTGLTGYVISGGSLRMDLEYLCLKDAFKTQHPKYVLLDMSAIRYKGQQVEGIIHKSLDQLPVTGDKIAYILENKKVGLDLLNSVFPFFRYHDRWKELKKIDFVAPLGKTDHSAVRGHGFGFTVVPAEYNYYSEVEFELPEKNRTQLQALVDLCRENGATPIFMKTVSPDWTAQYSKIAEELAKEMGVDYLNLASPLALIQMQINLKTDFRDAGNHVNQCGAEKNSEYLANYLMENYDLTDHRGEYTSWDQDIESYHKFKQKMSERSDLSE